MEAPRCILRAMVGATMTMKRRSTFDASRRLPDHMRPHRCSSQMPLAAFDVLRLKAATSKNNYVLCRNPLL